MFNKECSQFFIFNGFTIGFSMGIINANYFSTFNNNKLIRIATDKPVPVPTIVFKLCV